MRPVILRLSDRDAFIAKLCGSGAVYAPVRKGEGAVFAPVTSASEIAPAWGNTVLSVKGLFFPQREVLMSFGEGGQTSAALPAEPFTAFGVRPCDARALCFLDRVFGSSAGRPGNAPFEDPYYLERRRLGTVIALACSSAMPGCFCASTGGDPYGSEGADVLMSTAGGSSSIEAYILEPATPRGASLLEGMDSILRPAEERDLESRKERARAARAAQRPVGLSGIKERLDAAFDSPAWAAAAETCLGCGACAYACPACHCFDITDEPAGNGSARVRTWDSCQFAQFTAHASGHNPRPGKRERMRQRLMHKFSIAVETAGTVLCSGCGRCVRACPAGLDIREMLAAAAGGRA